MSVLRRDAKILLWCGVVYALWGLINVALDAHAVSEHLRAFGRGTTLGFAAHAAIGLLAIVVARCLLTIERGLNRVSAAPDNN